MKPEDQPTGEAEAAETKGDAAAAGNVCINRNSAGGTCAHYYSEHIDGGNQCTECDCAYFIPNP